MPAQTTRARGEFDRSAMRRSASQAAALSRMSPSITGTGMRAGSYAAINPMLQMQQGLRQQRQLVQELDEVAARKAQRELAAAEQMRKADLAERGFQEGVRQFDVGTGLRTAAAEEQKRQFDVGTGLRTAAAEEQKRQFGERLGMEKERFEYGKTAADVAREDKLRAEQQDREFRQFKLGIETGLQQKAQEISAALTSGRVDEAKRKAVESQLFTTQKEYDDLVIKLGRARDSGNQAEEKAIKNRIGELDRRLNTLKSRITSGDVQAIEAEAVTPGSTFPRAASGGLGFYYDRNRPLEESSVARPRTIRNP